MTPTRPSLGRHKILQVRSMPRVLSFVLTTFFCVCTANANDAGENLFLLHCATCHMPAAIGLSGLAPPLLASRGSAVAKSAATDHGRSYLVKVLSFGLVGPITVSGERYSGLMPNFAKLSDSELTSIANHLILTLNADVLPAGFAAYREAEFAEVRGKNLQPLDVFKLRRKLESIIPGATATTRSPP